MHGRGKWEKCRIYSRGEIQIPPKKFPCSRITTPLQAFRIHQNGGFLSSLELRTHLYEVQLQWNLLWIWSQLLLEFSSTLLDCLIKYLGTPIPILYYSRHKTTLKLKSKLSLTTCYRWTRFAGILFTKVIGWKTVAPTIESWWFWVLENQKECCAAQ